MTWVGYLLLYTAGMVVGTILWDRFLRERIFAWLRRKLDR